jgi:hypothetical protein
MTIKSIIPTIAVAAAMAAIPAFAPSTVGSLAPAAALACPNVLDLDSCDTDGGGCESCPEPDPGPCDKGGTGPVFHSCGFDRTAPPQPEFPGTVPARRPDRDLIRR